MQLLLLMLQEADLQGDERFMYTAMDFKKAYSDYIQQHREYLANMSLTGKALDMFGFRGARGKETAFEEFYSEMKSAVKAVCDEGPDTETADGIAEVIFNARNLYADEEVQEVKFIAVEGVVLELIPFMSREKAAMICENYSTLYPKHRRLPVQKQLVKALEKTARK